MRQSRKLPTMLAASLSLVLAACETPTNGLTEAAKTAASIGHISVSPRDTCETQRQAAAQSSRIDTIKTGKEVVYQPDKSCEAKKVASR